jgi:hypothetical protein
MKIKTVFICVLVLLCLFSLVTLCSVKSELTQPIIINSDGSVSGTSDISRDGNIYRLTANIEYSPLVVLRNDIILDGEGFVLQGTGGWGNPGASGVDNVVAINLTSSNVTVCNFNIDGWQVGVLGAYDGNTITHNNITATERCVAIYADDYNISGNYLTSSIYGVRMQGNNIRVVQNQIADNYAGLLISGSSGVATGNTFKNNHFAVNIDDASPNQFQFCLNNFVINPSGKIISTTSDAVGLGNNETMPPWDNGTVGNYWSDYTNKYPNVTQVDGSGIGDTAYLIRVSPTVVDRYPIMEPIATANITLQSPSPITPSPTPQIPELTPTAILALTIASMIGVLVLKKRQPPAA